MKIQQYFCERCRYAGSVTYRDGDGLSGVVAAIVDDHRANSPNCVTAEAIRIRTEELCSDTERKEVTTPGR